MADRPIHTLDTETSAPKHDKKPPARWRRWLNAWLLIIAAGSIGVIFSQSTAWSTERDLLRRSAWLKDKVTLLNPETDPVRASAFLEAELGLRVTTPTISGCQFKGIGIVNLADTLQQPAFLFTDTEDREVVVFPYDYVFLDRHVQQFQLNANIQNAIAEAGHFEVFTHEDDYVLVWRNHDDIYVAITEINGTELRHRISMG